MTKVLTIDLGQTGMADLETGRGASHQRAGPTICRCGSEMLILDGVRLPDFPSDRYLACDNCGRECWDTVQYGVHWHDGPPRTGVSVIVGAVGLDGADPASIAHGRLSMKGAA